MRLFASLLFVAHSALGSAISWPPAFNTDTIPTWAFPGRTDEMLNSTMLEFYSKFQLLDISGVNLSCYKGQADPVRVTCPGGLSNWVGNQEVALPATAGQFRQIRDQSYVFPYVYFGCSQAWHQSGKIFDDSPNWWVNKTTSGKTLTCNSFGYAFDFTIPDVKTFFLNTVVKPLLTPDTSGVFFDEVLLLPFVRCVQDNCTSSFIQDIIPASLDVVRSTCKLATSMNKLAIMSFNPHRVPQDTYNDIRNILAEEGGMHYFEFFCAWGGSGCLKDVIDMSKSVSMGIPIQAHAPFSPGEDIQFKLGGFLLAMGNYSYFSWGKANDWTLDAFPWVPEYDKKLGSPLGLAQNKSNLWWRHFEHATVTVNFDTSKGNITWSE
eukprot:TRINITY_DN4240_c0_g1_i1.p1 TRINITY_DN4240_c0_g1~~TRINITY_DN4240_c0_g1_i1.p1  ORF type:complete len:391 (+),score=49.28 TRINITY_DN4240_c0_g1_i1:41-1174(+)